MSKLNALIAGSTGYIGIQLIKLLIKHPNIKLSIYVETLLPVSQYIILIILSKIKIYQK